MLQLIEIISSREINYSSMFCLKEYSAKQTLIEINNIYLKLKLIIKYNDIDR